MSQLFTVSEVSLNCRLKQICSFADFGYGFSEAGAQAGSHESWKGPGRVYAQIKSCQEFFHAVMMRSAGVGTFIEDEAGDAA
ncbi:MAG: hypothetical protein U1F81_25085 [Verrucomicrobiaceae bacterium]